MKTDDTLTTSTYWLEPVKHRHNLLRDPCKVHPGMYHFICMVINKNLDTEIWEYVDALWRPPLDLVVNNHLPQAQHNLIPNNTEVLLKVNEKLEEIGSLLKTVTVNDNDNPCNFIQLDPVNDKSELMANLGNGQYTCVDISLYVDEQLWGWVYENGKWSDEPIMFD